MTDLILSYLIIGLLFGLPVSRYCKGWLDLLAFMIFITLTWPFFVLYILYIITQKAQKPREHG